MIDKKLLVPVKLPFGKSIYQLKNNHSVTSDVVDLVKIIIQNCSNKSYKVLELGSGNGIISIMLSFYFPEWKIKGLEIQSQLVELAKSNAQICGKKIEFCEQDLRKLAFPAEEYDLIISNPPYYPAADKRVSPDYFKAVSRFEILCNMEDIFFTISRELNKNGKAFVIYPLKRYFEIKEITKKVDLKITQKFAIESVRDKGKIVVEINKMSRKIC